MQWGLAADVFEAYKKFEPALTGYGIPSNIFYEESRALGVEGSTGSPTCWACVLPEALACASTDIDSLVNDLTIEEINMPSFSHEVTDNRHKNLLLRYKFHMNDHVISMT